MSLRAHARVGYIKTTYKPYKPYKMVLEALKNKDVSFVRCRKNTVQKMKTPYKIVRGKGKIL